jgi:hypothetical protein
MSEQWMNVAEAAAAMRVHPRTVERRIAAGKIESRRNDDGQVQILVSVTESPDTSAAMHNDALVTVRELADRQVDIAAGSASALVRVAQEQTIRAENQLVLAREDAGRYRREAQMSLGLVACMLLAVIVAVGWSTHAITAAKADADNAVTRAATAADIARQAASDRDDTRARLEKSLVDQARAEGELAAYRTELATVIEQTKRKAAATQPSNLVARIEQAFAGD